LTDGGADNQGMQPAGTPKVDIDTISNTGPVALMLSGTPIATSISNVQDVTVAAPGSLTLESGLSTTFKSTFKATAAGAFSFDLDVSSDDAGEAIYDIAATGMASDITPSDAPVIASHTP